MASQQELFTLEGIIIKWINYLYAGLSSEEP